MSGGNIAAHIMAKMKTGIMARPRNTSPSGPIAIPSRNAPKIIIKKDIFKNLYFLEIKSKVNESYGSYNKNRHAEYSR